MKTSESSPPRVQEARHVIGKLCLSQRWKTHENPECQANDSLERGATCGAGILSEGENEPCIEIDVAWLLHVCISHTTRRLMRGVNVSLSHYVHRSACDLNCDLQNLWSSNFKRLVLVCIEADFCNQILIGKRLTRSTISAISSRPKFSKFQF